MRAAASKSQLLLLTILTILVILPQSGAQTQVATQQPEQEKIQAEEEELVSDFLTVNIDVSLLSILAIVRDKDGNYVSGLNAGDFLVYEDGIEQRILGFEQDTVPVNVVFLIDASWSVTDHLPKICEAAIAFAKHLKPEDRFSVIVFAHEPKMLLDWSGDVNHLVEVLKGVKTFGRTAIYDAIDFSLRRQFSGVVGKKAIILLTDAIDNSSHITLEEAIRRARRAEVTLYPVIHSVPYLAKFREMLRENRKFLVETSKELINILRAQNQFVDLSLRSGGRVIFSDRFMDLTRIYERIIQELKNQYKITFSPSKRSGDGDKTRRIEVRLRNGVGTAFVRLGYFR